MTPTALHTAFIFTLLGPSPATKVALLYGLYSSAVEVYARRKLKFMNEALGIGGSSSSTASIVTKTVSSTPAARTMKGVEELRSTINKRTNLVENPKDRQAWNAWLMTSAATSSSGSSSSNTAPPSSSSSLSSTHPLAPGASYSFSYRSYVNYEEKWILCNALLSLHFFLFAQIGKGKMTIQKDGKHVKMVERFRFIFLPCTVQWNGVIETDENCRIVWTDTIMKLGWKTIVKPTYAEKLRQIPWEILKEEKGLVGFRRGDVGYLAYDRE